MRGIAWPSPKGLGTGRSSLADFDLPKLMEDSRYLPRSSLRKSGVVFRVHLDHIFGRSSLMAGDIPMVVPTTKVQKSVPPVDDLLVTSCLKYSETKVIDATQWFYSSLEHYTHFKQV